MIDQFSKKLKKSKKSKLQDVTKKMLQMILIYTIQTLVLFLYFKNFENYQVKDEHVKVKFCKDLNHDINCDVTGSKNIGKTKNSISPASGHEVIFLRPDLNKIVAGLKLVCQEKRRKGFQKYKC